MIRAFTTADLDSILTLWLDTNLTAHHFIDGTYWRSQFPMVKELLPQADIYIYEENGTIKGFVGLMEDYIAGIFISATAQSKGIGKQLLDYTKTLHEELSLHVYQQNEGALRFYQREGFAVLDNQVDQKTGEVELFMKWKKQVLS